MRWWLIGGVIGVLLLPAPIQAENPGHSPQKPRRAAIKTICLNPVGVAKKQGQRAWIEISPEYAAGLTGLQEFSHLWVFYWFHGNDNPEERRTLQVHPRRIRPIP